MTEAPSLLEDEAAVMELSEYNLQTLRKDGDFILYRGRHRRQDEGIPPSLLVRTPFSERPALGSLRRMEHELSLKAELNPEWAVRPLALAQHQGRTMLLLEDPGGEPLELLLAGPMALGQALRLAVGLCAALARLHGRGLIHKEIKPANVFVNASTGEVWLTGFGIASRLPRERQSPEPPEFIAGTLAYMAPEQTGRMNRSIDSRSDLYALGITLYEMLTGSLPFTASDPMEWVHCHTARQPVAPAERLKDVPATLSAIVMKLLAKTAEERYQTAAGVESDLRRCLAQWETGRRIGDFPPGEHDTPDRLLIPEKLYGRAREIETLLAAFDRVVTSGAPELVLVSGYSGIGKSSVVNELHKALVPPRGLFAAGKFDQYKRDIPYSTLAQAFQSLVGGLLAKSEADLGAWRDALREALGPNGELMVDLVPELKLIIGDQPPMPELPPQDAKRRFQLVFRRFMGVFARPEHPLALFLDDLQWLDTATLDLLEDLLTQADVRHLLLIGAYRDNEVDPRHPLMRKLEAVKSAGAKMEEITLAPLAREHLEHLIADALRCESGRAAPLAQLVQEKTAGNPFFAIQFLSALAEEGLLIFDHGKGCWSWDLTRIHAKGYTDNVVELLVGKLSRLRHETQSALQQLACLGNITEITMLSMVLGTSETALHLDLREAVRQELIERREGSYRFVHDRVQEAAYSLIPEDLRAEAHLRIGRLLAAHTPPERREEAIFDIVNQLNRGAGLITSQDEREQLAALNLIAAKRAKASTAYASALTYVTASAALLPEDAWESRQEFTFALELERAECAFLTGKQVEAEVRLAELARRAASLPDLAAVTRLRVEFFASTERRERAVEVGLDYLRRVGIAWSAHPTQEELRKEFEEMWRQIGERPIEALLDLPLMTERVAYATMDVLNALVTAAWHTDETLRCLAVGRMANLSLNHGTCDISCLAYEVLGTVLGPHFGDYRAAYRFGQLGIDLVERRGLGRFKARAYLIFGNHVMPSMQPIRTCLSFARHALYTAQQAGDVNYATYSRHHLVTNLLASGNPLGEVEREAEAGLNYAREARIGLAVNRITGQIQLIRTLRGLTPTFGCLDDAGFDEEQFERHLQENPRLTHAACWYWIRKLQARVLVGDNTAAITAAEEANRLLWTSSAIFERAEFHFYAALAQAALGDAVPAVDRDALAANHRQLQRWAENCPENFEDRASLVAAEMARIAGRTTDAMRLYEEAIRSARENGFVHNEALANEFASRFYAARGFEKIARMYLRDARYGYLRWGADGKVRQLDQLHPYLREEERTPDTTGTMGTPVEHLDLATVIKVSQAVSGEVVPEKLIETLMHTAIEHAGAQRGLLIVPRDGELSIRAEANTSGNAVTICLRAAPLAATELPESVVHYAARTHESVILADASARNPFSTDEYICKKHARSVLCLPLVKQGALVALLYLENSLTSRAFTPERVAVLHVLASQAAMSLETSRLYHELREREAKIRRLVEADFIGIFFWDFDGRILEANDAFLEVVGYDREDLVAGRIRWTDLTPAEWRNRDAQWVEEHKRTGFRQPIEKEYFRKDGSRVPILLGAATFEEGGNQGVAFVLDLTERKRTEEALRASEKKYRELIDAAPDAIFVWDSQARCVLFNASAARLNGCSEDEMIGLSWAGTYPPAERDRVLERFDQVKEQGVLRFERPFLRKNNEVVPVEVSLSTAGEDQYQAVVRDISDHKKAEEILRERASLLDLAHDTVFVRNMNDVITYWNRGAEELYGWTRQEAVGRVSYHLLRTIFPERLDDINEKLLRAGRWEGELIHVTHDGTRVVVASRWALQRDERGNPSAILETNNDITERKKAEEALRRSHDELEMKVKERTAELRIMNDELQSVNKELEAFAYSVSHDLRAPIRHIAGFTELLQKHADPVLDDKSRRHISMILGATNRMGSLVDDLLAFSRIGRAETLKTTINLEELVKEVVGEIAPDTRGRRIRWHIGKLPICYGDPSLLRLVFGNLVSNAVKFTRTRPQAEIEISSLNQRADEAVVLIKDNGVGFDMKYKDKLFGVFQRLHSQEVFEGTGIGLATVQRIVHRHGGRVWGEGSVDKGATFYIALPNPPKTLTHE